MKNGIVPLRALIRHRRPSNPGRWRRHICSAICVLTFRIYDLFSSPVTSSYLNAQNGRRSVPPAAIRIQVHKKLLVDCMYNTSLEGKKLAESMSKERLAACVNRALNQFITGRERLRGALLINKTQKSLLESLTQHVKANHEYEVPEVIALPILGGNDEYLEWIKSSTRD